MTPAVQKEYDEMFSTFATEGWKIYVRSMQDHIDVLERTTLDDCNSLEDLYKRRGQIISLRYATTIQETTENLYKITMEDLDDDGN